MLPLIGVTAGEVLNNNEAWAPSVYGQARTYTDAVLDAGGVPLIIPFMNDCLEALRTIYNRCDGLLLSGGNDIDPALYAAVPQETIGKISRQRDEQETQLFQWALKDGKPILGICRGQQLLNVALHGSLYQDISTEVPNARGHQISQQKQDFLYVAHTLRIAKNSQLYRILGTETIVTNALHHQAIKILGEGLVATAWSEDEMIEAIELPTAKGFLVAVQSHPEALQSVVEPRWQNLFSAFVQASTGAV